MTYQKSINNKNEETKQRKIKIIWFNPPYSKNVLTKVRNQFLKLINKHFPQHHKFYKLFNKNNVKVSYISMPNMKNITNTHNKKIIKPPKDNITRACNCISKHQCPLANKKCLTNNVYTKQVSHQTKKIRKQKFIMALAKQHLSSDMQTIKKRSITSNIRLIQNYQTNIGTLYQQAKLQTYSGKFWEPTNHTTKVLNNVSYVSMKSWQ